MRGIKISLEFLLFNRKNSVHFFLGPQMIPGKVYGRIVRIEQMCPGDTVQTGTGKVDPARKFKCTTRLPVIGTCLVK